MRKGIGVSPGVVVGRRPPGGVGPRLDRADRRSTIPARSRRRSSDSTGPSSDSAADLETLIQKVAQELGDSAADIFKGHLQIVNDPALVSKVHDLIENKQMTALSALADGHADLRGPVRADRAGLFPRADERRPRRHPADRLAPDAQADRSTSMAAGESRNGDESVILVAHEILPSQAMSLGDLPIAGIVTEIGGSTSHAAILARSRGIPAVSGVEGVMGDVENGDLMIVDGRDGMVIVRPDQEATSAYRKVQREFFNLKDRLVANRDQPGPQRRRHAGRAAGEHQQPRRCPGRPEGRGHGRRAVPDRVPLPHPSRRPRRGGAVRVLPPDHPQLAQPDGHDPDPRPGRRQDRPLPRPTERAQPVHGLAVDPHLLRELEALRHPDPGDPPRRPPRPRLDALPHDHHPGRAAVRQQAGQGDAEQPAARGGALRRGRQDRRDGGGPGGGRSASTRSSARPTSSRSAPTT